MSKVYVENENSDIIGRVEENRKIGEVSTGQYLGYTKIKDGRYVLIHTSQWVGDHNWAEIISKTGLVEICVRNDCYGALVSEYPECDILEDLE